MWTCGLGWCDGGELSAAECRRNQTPPRQLYVRLAYPPSSHPTSVLQSFGCDSTPTAQQTHRARRHQTLRRHETSCRRQTKLARAATVPVSRRPQGSRSPRRPYLSTKQRPALGLLEGLPPLRQRRHRLMATYPLVLALCVQLAALALPPTHREPI